MFLVIGGIAGIIGGIMNEVNRRINLLRIKLRIRRKTAVFEVFTVAVFFALAAFLLPYFCGTCKDLEAYDIEEVPYKDDLIQFYCNPGE